MIQSEEITEANRRSWNHAAARRRNHWEEQVAFFREGGSTLFPEEAAMLGDLEGKALVHLQCHSGQDTLTIARDLGAQVLGVDISEEAIGLAQSLASESGIEAKFVCADLYRWFDEGAMNVSADVVLSSYSSVPWLTDLKAWGRGVNQILKPGGRLVMIEYHPMVSVFDDQGDYKVSFDYMGGAMIEEVDGVPDYAGESAPGLMIPFPSGDAESKPSRTPASGEEETEGSAYSFAWGVAETVSALTGAGLNLVHFKEYPYCNGWKPFPRMVEKPGRRVYLPEGMPKLPLMYSVICEKPA